MVAINPFKDVQLYGNDFITAYRQKLTDSPHVYAIADTAFNEMMRGINILVWRKNFGFLVVTNDLFLNY